MDTSIAEYDGLTNTQRVQIVQMVTDTHAHLAQLDLPVSQRTITARNYDSAIAGLRDYLQAEKKAVPTKSTLEKWRDDMKSGRVLSSRGKPYAVKSINARLSAVRKLLRAIADDATDITLKLVLRDWATIEDAKETRKQDLLDTDYGIRLSLESVEKLVNSVDTSHLKGLRDRALIGVMVGAGLRVSEVVNLTVRDVFLTENESGQRGILVKQGKHNKSRVVVLNSWGGWVIEVVEAYAAALGLTPLTDPDETVFYGVQRATGGDYISTGEPLSTRGAQRAVEAYRAEHNGKLTTINAHDLRRTYAKLCKSAGMQWDALRENLGHSSVTITEDYVGHEVDWSERVPNWKIKIKT